MQSYFIWKGTDSRTMGLISKAHAPLIRPEERVAHVQIPGRSGDLTVLEGSYIYNSYIQTVSFSVQGAANVNAVFKWLRGKGYVTFSGEPDRKQSARVIGAITLERVSRNLDTWRGTAQFYCDPLKQALPLEDPTFLTAAGTVRNNGDVPAFPLIFATPALGATTMTITVGGKTLTISNVTGEVRIDCEAQEASNSAMTTLLTQDTGGPFPVLAIGNNTISGSGWSSLEIYKNERFL